MAELRPLNDTEALFAEKVAGFFNAIGELQAGAAAVIASGGDPKTAFLSLFAEGPDRDAMAMQWPMVSMLLGAN